MEDATEKKARKFKVGDRVYAPFHGYGTVIGFTKTTYPIVVEWDDTDKCAGGTASFTEDGYFWSQVKDAEYSITVIEKSAKKDGTEMGLISSTVGDKVDGKYYDDYSEPERDISLANKDMKGDDDTVDYMLAAMEKKAEDAINPSHYKVEGLPEAIDIINHLMNRGQYEGFLWGNILKYAYRYGRKGEKAETAGKIAWYANQLKDLAEEGDRK